ncbi:hypothetical protein Droror1_Dr00023504 [Drosera rotundifolia]
MSCCPSCPVEPELLVGLTPLGRSEGGAGGQTKADKTGQTSIGHRALPRRATPLYAGESSFTPGSMRPGSGSLRRGELLHAGEHEVGQRLFTPGSMRPGTGSLLFGLSMSCCPSCPVGPELLVGLTSPGRSEGDVGGRTKADKTGRRTRGFEEPELRHAEAFLELT